VPRPVCPFCFEKLPRNQAAFRCINPNPSKCKPEPDTELGNYLRLPSAPAKPRVFTATASWLKAPTSSRCKCGMKTTKSVCIHCHNELPSQFASTHSFTVALIGAQDAGKSHYIAVLINELKNRIGPRLNASVNAMDDETIRRYNTNFRRYIYELGEEIPKTRTARDEVRYPLVYRMSIRRRRFGMKGLLVTSMVFFDTAGEDLDNIDVMSTETKYIANSDGILFLLDPLQIPAVQGQLKNKVPLPEIHTEPQEIINRVAQLVRESRGMRLTDPIETPVALVFSKIDAVRVLIDPGSSIHRASRHDGYFNLGDVHEVSESMRAYVREWVGPGLDTFLQHNFKTFGYFGASALGASPDSSGRLTLAVAPFRVEDPLLWILYQLGVVRGREAS